MIVTQLITGVTFGLVAFALNLSHFFSISIALLAIVAFSGATHDIACDGVYMSELSNEDQAKFIGWQGAFYNIAKILATGGLVYLAGYFIELNADAGLLTANKRAWMIILLILSVTMIPFGNLSLCLLCPLPSRLLPGKTLRSNKEVMKELGQVLMDIFPQDTHHLLYLLHHPLPFCRRICDEDCAAVPESRPGDGRIGTQ